MKKRFAKLSILSLTLLTLNNINAQTGTWTALANQAPDANEGVMMLMTDGTVMCFSNPSGGSGQSSGWDKLTPSASGSYVNGTWTRKASMVNSRLFFASQVLPSGKLYVAGGEYGTGTKGEVYDPVANTWTSFNVPNGWNDFDGNSELLYNGDVLEGPQQSSGNAQGILVWNPSTATYTTGTQAPLNHDEAAWLKLPDSTILYMGCPIGESANLTCRYQPKTAAWLNDANTPNNSYDPYGYEAGCALQLPNGKDIFFGSTKYNNIYTPAGNSESTGSWAAAANMPSISGAVVGQVDAPGAMMINGHILLGVSPGNSGTNDQFRAPLWFIEYDYKTNTFTQVTGTIPGITPLADSIPGAISNLATFLDLPDGNVLFSIEQSGVTQYWVYTPNTSITGIIPQGKPTIDSIAIRSGCDTYEAFGKLFNGISEGAGFGDDWQMSTNYPLIRITDGSNIWYTKTTNWNRLGFVAGSAATDSLLDSVSFAVPTGLLAGTTYTLYVVVNGFQSNPTLFTTLGSTVASQTNVKCHGGSNGSVTAGTAVGGIAPYTYKWSPGGSTNLTISSLSAGTFTLTVTDKRGCTATTLVTITQPVALAAVPINKVNVSCHGGNSGSLTAAPTEGAAPYTYLWTGGTTNNPLTGLTAGSYTVTVTDACGTTASASATLTQPSTSVALSASVVADVKCTGQNNGDASASASGGVSPYTYSWSGGGTSSSETTLSSGSYTVTVTDKNGCTATASVSITQPAISLSAITNVASEVKCKGENDGSASVAPSGGTSPYTYSWSGGGTSSSETTLTAGSYTVTVTDKHGCTTTASVSLTQPATGITTTASVTNSLACHGGDTARVLASPSGGAAPYTYAWTGGGTNATKTGLSSGTYSITVTDGNGCTASAAVTITQPAAIVSTKYQLAAATSTACNGIAAVTVISGGSSPYTYLWSPGGESTDTIKNLCVNNYCCTITDSKGCSDSVCISVNNAAGIPNIGNASDISIYPDPNNGSFTVAGVTRGQEIEVYNDLGQQLSSTLVDKVTMYFDISNRADGIYLIRIVNRDGSLVTQKKIIKAQ